MRSSNARLLTLLSFALAISGCKSGGGYVQPTCPALAPPPASLMTEPTTEAKVRRELFELPQSATPKSADSKPW